MDAEELKEDVRAGRIDTDRLIDLICRLQRELDQARRRIEELERRLEGSPTQKLKQPFSVKAEEQRQIARGTRKRKRTKPLRRGRVSTAEKIARAVRTQPVVPAGFTQGECRLSHTRPLWRLENGQAVLVAYEVYRRGNQYGQIPGALGRSEFGLEVVLAIAYQVYILGLSFDKVCAVMPRCMRTSLTRRSAGRICFARRSG